MDDPDINEFKKDPIASFLNMVYILKFGVPTHPESFEELEAFNRSDFRIGHTMVGDLEVSTVFLTYPSSTFLNGEFVKAHFFETGIMGGGISFQLIARYMSLPEAQKGHQAIVDQLSALQTQSFDYTREYLDRLTANASRE